MDDRRAALEAIAYSHGKDVRPRDRIRALELLNEGESDIDAAARELAQYTTMSDEELDQWLDTYTAGILNAVLHDANVAARFPTTHRDVMTAIDARVTHEVAVEIARRNGEDRPREGADSYSTIDADRADDDREAERDNDDARPSDGIADMSRDPLADMKPGWELERGWTSH
jgi:hypothetical protein